MTTSTVIPSQPAPGTAVPEPRVVVAPVGIGDRIFRIGAALSGAAVMAVMVAVGLFLTIEAVDALRTSGVSFLTTQEWQPDRGEFGVAALIPFTVMIAIIAVVVAVPVSIGTSLFITEVVPPGARSWIVAMVDLMAAVPSVVYGLWGLFLLQGHVVGLSRWLTVWFSWVPFFAVDGDNPTSPLGSASSYTASTFVAGIVVSMMVVPIATSIMREVFSQVPSTEREGAFALGSTRWGMIRVVALPFGRAGIIGGTMLGLGRALGETIAVYLIISPRFDITSHVLEAGTNSVSAHIALQAPEASGFGLSALMAAGLVLFAMTIVVNFIASAFVASSRSGSSS